MRRPRYIRDVKGVKIRADGQGDGWANAHRIELPANFYLTDIDGLFGEFTIAQNVANTLFIEYVPDGARGQEVSVSFAWVACFDRKRHEGAILGSRLSTAFYLDLCRKVSRHQPIPARFFFVVGPDAGPWRMKEVDLTTGAVSPASHELHAGSWLRLYDELGLRSAREELQDWLRGAVA